MWRGMEFHILGARQSHCFARFLQTIWHYSRSPIALLERRLLPRSTAFLVSWSDFDIVYLLPFFIIHRVAQKLSRKLLSTALPSTDQFSKIFHRLVLWKINRSYFLSSQSHSIWRLTPVTAKLTSRTTCQPDRSTFTACRDRSVRLATCWQTKKRCELVRN